MYGLHTRIEQHVVDPRCMQSIAHYVSHGMPPGGFCEHLLADNLDQARAHAGVALRKEYFGEDVTVSMREVLLLGLPTVCWGSKSVYSAWVAHGGLHGASAGTRMLFKLGIPNLDVWRKIISYHSFGRKPSI